MYNKKAVRDKKGRIIHEVRARREQNAACSASRPPPCSLLHCAHLRCILCAGLAIEGATDNAHSA